MNRLDQEEALEDARTNWAASVNRNAISAAWARYSIGHLPDAMGRKYGEQLDKSLTESFDAALAGMTTEELADIGFELGVCLPFRLWLQGREEQGAA